MLKKLISVCLIVMIIFCTCAFTTNKVEAASTSNKVVRVLFIGNSKTYYNIMPKIFKNVVSHSGTNTTVYYLTLTAGGRTLTKHASLLALAKEKNSTSSKWSSTTVKENGTTISEYSSYRLAITNEWDYVILQGQTDESYNSSTLYSASKSIIETLTSTNNGRKLNVIYNAIWPTYTSNISTTKTLQSSINSAYKTVAAKSATKGTVAYTGSALMNYMTDYGKSSVYISDNNHPTHAGSYIEACVLYRAVFGGKTSGISYYGKVTDGCTYLSASYNYGIVYNFNNANSFGTTSSTNRKSLSTLGSTLAKRLQKYADNV